MEALVVRALRVACLVFLLSISMGANHRTQNFVVTADTPGLAREIGEAAEEYRVQLALEWLGHELPPWRTPCDVRANVNPDLGAGGATSFLFASTNRQYGRPTSSGDGLFRAAPSGTPYGWEMTLQGSRERVLDSVLPHEITHTIFATHFGRPLPRWADEGACTTVEHESEKNKQHRLLYEFLTTNRGIPFNRMFAMSEYPADILPLYSQGFSLARYLIAQGGRQKFVQYIGTGLESNDWTSATRTHYGFDSISDLQVTWLEWVRNGSVEAPTTPPASNGPRLDAVVGHDRGSQSPQPASPGWYAARSEAHAHQSTDEPASIQLATLPPQSSAQTTASPRALRVSSRPQPDMTSREVLIEWGSPSPFLAPSLTRRPTDTPR